MPLNTNIRVLIVDDFATMRKIIKNILIQLGFKDIVEAQDGVDALEILKKQRIDLIISDWNMPKMTGLDLLKAVRSNEDFKGIKFIMITAESQKENVIEAIKNGVNQYVIKPFTPKTLQEKLEKILEER